MMVRFERASALVLVLVYLLAAAPVSARPDPPGAHRTLGSATAARTTIVGTAWTADNMPIAGARLRLRNVVTGRIEATTTANEAGRFAFEDVEGGSYLVELVDDRGRMQVAGHVFTVAPGETVATFVRLGTKVPWFTEFFGTAVSAVTAAAASEGVTALAPVARPVSANR